MNTESIEENLAVLFASCSRDIELEVEVLKLDDDFHLVVLYFNVGWILSFGFVLNVSFCVVERIGTYVADFVVILVVVVVAIWELPEIIFDHIFGLKKNFNIPMQKSSKINYFSKNISPQDISQFIFEMSFRTNIHSRSKFSSLKWTLNTSQLYQKNVRIYYYDCRNYFTCSRKIYQWILEFSS